MGMNGIPNIPKRRSRITRCLQKRIKRVITKRKSQLSQRMGVNDKPNIDRQKSIRTNPSKIR
jgi:hypothetical protein